MNDEKKEDPMANPSTSQDERRGILKTLIEHFSSTPIVDASDDAVELTSNASNHSVLTESEREYLQRILNSGDAASIEAASQRLSDPTLFAKREEDEQDAEEQQREEACNNRTDVRRRDSHVQQELFRLHELHTLQPSRVLRRMSLVHQNSILQQSSDDVNEQQQPSLEDVTEPSHYEAAAEDSVSDWDPFKDISSWLDGSEGVEVNDNGVPLPETSASSRPKAAFKILGTAADDVSCHPHVLSPPLMESLLAFLPESLTSFNFWLKYSLVRDGGGLWNLLRQVRASTNCFLAIETTEGHVFGAFTTQSWRLAKGWYGSNESFLWKMRRPRLETKGSIFQQVCAEGEIQVYPYRSGNVAVQFCSKECIMLGQGELLPATKTGKHYGHALFLEADLSKGTTSTSETFGNPCLVDAEQRGARFDVSNIEVWTLTPHETVSEAEQSELSALFLEGGRSDTLNFMNILIRPI